MQLSVSTEEAQDLKQALDAYLVELEFELARTEAHALEHVLHLRYDHLQSVRDQLSRLLGGQQEAPAGPPM